MKKKNLLEALIWAGAPEEVIADLGGTVGYGSQEELTSDNLCDAIHALCVEFNSSISAQREAFTDDLGELREKWEL